MLPENHYLNKLVRIEIVDNILYADNKFCFNKIRQCPIRLPLPENDKQKEILISHLQCLGSPNGYHLSDSFDYEPITNYNQPLPFNVNYDKKLVINLPDMKYLEWSTETSKSYRIDHALFMDLLNIYNDDSINDTEWEELSSKDKYENVFYIVCDYMSQIYKNFSERYELLTYEKNVKHNVEKVELLIDSTQIINSYLLAIMRNIRCLPFLNLWTVYNGSSSWLTYLYPFAVKEDKILMGYRGQNISILEVPFTIIEG